MGKLVKYVVLLSHLSLVLGIQQLKDSNDRGKQDNFTLALKQFHTKDQNEFFKRALPLGPQGRRRPQPPRGKLMVKTMGLNAYSDQQEWRGRKKNTSEAFRGPSKRSPVPPFPQNLIPWRNFKNGPPDFHGRKEHHRATKLYNKENSFFHQNKVEEQEKNRRYHIGGRSGRFQHSTHAAKICDPCNSVPWVPLLKVPDSYRQERTHLHQTHQNFNSFGSDSHGGVGSDSLHGFGSDSHGGFGSGSHGSFGSHSHQSFGSDSLHAFGSESHQSFGSDSHNAFSSDTHNVLLPPIPLIPPAEPIYDGTISSSFGLPIGNIPTGHGLLAPINHLASKFNRYGANAIDYSYFPTQDLLGTNLFPELSPVPIVPIHDSNQFYQIPDLVPPPAKPVDVSKVVLTINENNPANTGPHDPHSGTSNKDLKPAHGISKVPESTTTKNHNIGSLEIVKSVPLAEFTSSVNYPSPGSQQLLPLYPPLQSEYSNNFHDHKQEAHAHRSVDHSVSDMNFLVPPPPEKKIESDTTFDSTKNTVLPFMNPPKSVTSITPDKQNLKESESAPKPLTSPSLSWLFSDHTAQPTVSKTTESVAQAFARETQEIAAIVNSELRPVSPHPFPSSTAVSQNTDSSKSKKIQIIIPYTTKNKSGYDNNALESVQHEVFQKIQPPVSKAVHHNNSSRESATSGRPLQSEINRRRPNQPTEKRGDVPEDNYLSEMHHIIASNIRELLRDEIEKSQNDQNYPLQNNIDNWTALEYSNHKTVEGKAPKEIINQALAVTSIPGTSISHMLIPSKKIPTEYFGTTPVPDYDEPSTPPYNATTSSVNSKPFTAKSYATTNVYVPTSPNVSNHEKNYTEVGRGRVNNWGRLNENLVLPEARPGPGVEDSTASAWTSSRLFASSIGNQRVEIVTPIPLTTKRNYTTHTYRRTTRQIRTTEAPTTTTTTTTPTTTTPTTTTPTTPTTTPTTPTTTPKTPTTTPTTPTTTPTTTTTTTTTTQEPSRTTQKLVPLRNSTKLERVSNVTSLFTRNLNFNSTGNSSKSVSVVKSVSWTLPSGQSEELVRLGNASERVSINDIFPFRNKELPWESGVNATGQTVGPNGRQRNSLIKQVNLPKQKIAASS